MAPGYNVRVGDADREAVAAQLREHYADGRLTLEELNERLDQTFAATTKADLNMVMRDLPQAMRPGAGLPYAGTGWPGQPGPGRLGRCHPGRASATARAAGTAGHAGLPAPSPRCSAWSGCW